MTDPYELGCRTERLDYQGAPPGAVGDGGVHF